MMDKRQIKRHVKRAYAVVRLEYRTAIPMSVSGRVVCHVPVVERSWGLADVGDAIYEDYALVGLN